MLIRWDLGLNLARLTLYPAGFNPKSNRINAKARWINPVGFSVNPVGFSVNPVGFSVNPVGLRGKSGRI